MESLLLAAAESGPSIELIDGITIAVYLVGITAIGLWSVRRTTMTGDAYFLAGRGLGWGVIGSAMFAANISTIHLVGLAQDGYQRGLVVGNFEWMATFTLILLALVFAPFYLRTRITTLPEFLEKRYSSAARSIMAFMAILSALLIHIGISLYASAEVFEKFFGIDVYLSIGIISLATAIYTVLGGLKAVVVTETIQSVILLGGAVLLTVLGLARLGDHGIHSYADFNRKIDVQHSADSLGEAAQVLAGTDWLLCHGGEFQALEGRFRTAARHAEAEESRKTALDVQEIARQLPAARLSALRTILTDGKAKDVAEALRAAALPPPAPEGEAGGEGKDLPSPVRGRGAGGEGVDQLITLVKKTPADQFTAAADVIAKAAKTPDAAAADLMWSRGKNIKESEKLAFVAGVIDKTGHAALAELFADPSRWEKLPAKAAQCAAAAADLQREQALVLKTGDMNQYLQTTEPVRTPHLSVLRAEGPYYWLAILLGYPVLGVWYWCSDQTIVQRVLGARNQKNAQNGALFAGLLKITPVFVMVLPGTIAFVIFRDQIGDRSAQTLPTMVTELLPGGLKGLMAAALLAALMSTIAAALNSAGTLVAMDIVAKLRPKTSDAAQVRIGQISAIVVMLLAMAWSTQGGRFGTIFEVINKIPALFLAPPITTVFVWGVFWKRGTKQAAITTLALGLSVGFVLFLIDTGVFRGVQWISDERHGLGIPFLMQGVYLFLLWSAVYVAVSLLTPTPPAAQVENTTWPNPLAVIFHGKLAGLTDPRLLAGGLLAVMIVLYYVFR